MKKVSLIIIALLMLSNCFSIDKSVNCKNLLPYMFNKDTIKGWSANINNASELQITCIIDSLNYTKEQLSN